MNLLVHAISSCLLAKTIAAISTFPLLLLVLPLQEPALTFLERQVETSFLEAPFFDFCFGLEFQTECWRTVPGIWSRVESIPFPGLHLVFWQMKMNLPVSQVLPELLEVAIPF